MSLTRHFSILLCGVLFGATLCAQLPASPAANPAFEQLKSLAGTWEGKNGQGLAATLTYEIVSNGSAIMERLLPAHEAEMITLYSADGGRLVATHYCSMGNQPTLQTVPLAAAIGKYEFHFVRVAGTKSREEGHMTDLTLSMPDKDHLTQVWTFEDHGKSNVETFLWTRKK